MKNHPTHDIPFDSYCLIINLTSSEDFFSVVAQNFSAVFSMSRSNRETLLFY